MKGWARDVYRAFDENKEDKLIKMFKQGFPVDFQMRIHNYPANITAPTILACEHGMKNLLVTLLSFGGDINAVDSNGQGAVHILSLKGDVDMLQWMKELDANLAITDAKGNNGLHIAGRHGIMETAEYLVDQYVPLTHKNNKDETPIELTRRILDRTKNVEEFDTISNVFNIYSRHCNHPSPDRKRLRSPPTHKSASAGNARWELSQSVQVTPGDDPCFIRSPQHAFKRLQSNDKDKWTMQKEARIYKNFRNKIRPTASAAESPSKDTQRLLNRSTFLPDIHNK